ncbi:MAG TPA: zinc ribbon domain-containing protein [Acidobacteriaceae bacterium]|nr:zinc ribbon domain-containing protein [Acidobacteriaceae bacterium]
MDLACHRCGNPVREGDGFCAHCGAPQLTVEAADAAVQQQQQTVGFRADLQLVNWRAAIISALLVAVPVGMLSALTGGSSLFGIAGGFAAMALYRRRSAANTDGRVGWRIGSILGAASAFLATATYAAHTVIDRYWLHQGATMDREFQAAAQQGVDYWVRAMAAQGPQPPEVVNAMHRVTSFMVSPDGHAAGQLGAAVIMSLGIMLFAATGGAIAGRILAMRTRVQRSL